MSSMMITFTAVQQSRCNNTYRRHHAVTGKLSLKFYCCCTEQVELSANSTFFEWPACNSITFTCFCPHYTGCCRHLLYRRLSWIRKFFNRNSETSYECWRFSTLVAINHYHILRICSHRVQLFFVSIHNSLQEHMGVGRLPRLGNLSWW